MDKSPSIPCFERGCALVKQRREKGVLIVAFLLAIGLVTWTGGSRVVQTLAHGSMARTLVIDAGHGGFDGGAVGATGTTEQDINLSIAQRVQSLAAFFGVPTTMTRTNEQALDYDPSRSVRDNKIADIKAREQLVQDEKNPVFISIHLNKFSDPQYHGAQVFYSSNHAGSRALAELLQEALIAGCDPSNNRQARPAEQSIYLMKVLTCPAVIVECGFLSNPAEEALLGNEEYHKKLAACIVSGYLQYDGG